MKKIYLDKPLFQTGFQRAVAFWQDAFEGLTGIMQSCTQSPLAIISIKNL